jgi:hypothetical protein
MKTQEEVTKEIWARKVLLGEAYSQKRLGQSAADFIDTCTNRPAGADALNWEVWEAADVLPEAIEHIAAWIWTFRR